MNTAPHPETSKAGGTPVGNNTIHKTKTVKQSNTAQPLNKIFPTVHNLRVSKLRGHDFLENY